jgi:hypothetical protein
MSIAATIGAVGAVAGGAIGAVGATSAAGTQADAALSAQQLQAKESADALAFQKQQFQTQQTNAAPFLATGTQATKELASLTGTPGEGLLAPWTSTFKPPTAEEARATPGYQFGLNEGENALERSAAASGGLLTTGTAKGIVGYGQNLADTTYGQTYQRALDQYQLAYNTFQNNQTNTFNRLSTVSGGGQTAAAELAQQGQAAATGVTNINLTTGAQQGQALQNAGAATASGYVGATNAAQGSISGITQLLAYLAQQKNQTGPYGPGGINPESYPPNYPYG